MNKQNYTQDADMIQREIDKRNITYLCHFTTLKNASQILNRGRFLSRNTLEFDKVAADYQDDSRWEGKQYVNLSIQSPNKKLWGCFISKDPRKLWCLFRLRTRICLYQGVKFTTANATASNVRYNGTSVGLKGFNALFADKVVDTNGFLPRNPTLSPEFPTSEQAEVLVPEPIYLDDVIDIIVRNEEEKALLLTHAPISEHFITVDARIFPERLRCA